MTNIFKIFLLTLLTTTLHAGHFIRPPNGNEYKIEMINPMVQKWHDYEAIDQFFKEYGYVVIDEASCREDRDALVKLIDQLVEADIPCSRRLGFLDLYHDQTLAKLRQDPRIYEIFSHLLGREKLWVVFDRVIFQKHSEDEDALPPHVDQNPIDHPAFFNVQAMIALRNMDETTGTLAVIPSSSQFFHQYSQWVKPGDGYVEYQGELTAPFVGLRLKEGQLVIWDSRTTHSRYRGEAKSNRYAALITYTNAKEDQELIDLRLKAFTNGTGSNNHEAGLRATAPPRCAHSLRQTAEVLTPLGRKLYAIDPWE